MNLNDLLYLNKPTLADNESKLMAQAAFTRAEENNWPAYVTGPFTITERLPDDDENLSFLSRFIRFHATVPGIVTEETISLVPIGTFKWIGSGGHTTGAFWSNGFVFCYFNQTNECLICFFVSPEIAKRWSYPEPNGKELYQKLPFRKQS